MNIIQNLFEEVMEEAFSPENLILLLIENRLSDLEIKLTSRQEKRLKKELKKLELDSIKLKLKKSQLPSTDQDFIRSVEDSLDFSDFDEEKFIDNLEQNFPILISESIQEIAEILTEQLQKDSSKTLRSRRRDYSSYSKGIRSTWKEPLDLLEVFIGISIEAGLDFNLELEENEETEYKFTIDVMMRLQGRACQISNEILCLLANGYSDGAHARWRSLHEVTTIGYLISDGGEDLAERYILHKNIESYKAALQYQENVEKLGYEPLTDEELASLKSGYEELIDRYGRNYASSYGWASEILNLKNPTFRDIEKFVGLEHNRPFYKMASHNVHANPMGIFHKLGLFSWEGDLILAGPSYSGLADPGQGTAISLGQITTNLLTLNQPNLDNLVMCRILHDLTDEISKKFAKLQEELEAADPV